LNARYPIHELLDIALSVEKLGGKLGQVFDETGGKFERGGSGSRSLHFYITLVCANTHHIKELLARKGGCSMGATFFRKEGYEKLS